MSAEKGVGSAEDWSHSEGPRGSTIWVGERSDKDGSVYLRRTVDRKPVYKALSEYLSLAGPFRIRDDRGRILERQKQRAIDAAKQCVEDLRLGLDPFRSNRRATPVEPPAEKLTVKTAFDEALRSPKGMFVARTNHRKDQLACSELVLAALRSDVPVEDVSAGTAYTVWRFLLERAEHLNHFRRTAEKCVSVLFSVLRWLHEQYPQRYPSAPSPPRKWKSLLSAEWGQKFNVNLEYEDREQPRHSDQETRLIFQRIHQADDRIALMIEVCGEQRVGQVVRATRRDLCLDHDAGGFGLGSLDIRRHGRGKKTSTIIDLHPEARTLIDRILETGYLADLEAAFRRGDINDYHLWPHGKLREGTKSVASYLRGNLTVDEVGRRVRGKPTHMFSTTLIAMFHKFERKIGITPVKGRAFYGLRRVLADLGEDHTSDTRVLREVTGWTSEETRKRYQQKRNPKVLKAAAETRHQVRQAIRSQPEKDAAAMPPVDLSRLTLDQLQALIDEARKHIGEPE